MTLPGYEPFATLLTDLLATSPPPFIYIHDVITPHITSKVISSVLAALPDKPPFLHAFVNASTCFTARLLYDTVIRKLADWTPTWESGCQLWGDQRWNDNFDGFIHGLREISAERSEHSTAKPRGQNTHSTPKIAIVIERAEILKEYLPDLLVPLSRLAESVSRNWASYTQWLFFLTLRLGAVGSDCSIHIRASMVRTEATRRICPRPLIRPATRAQ